MNSFNSSSKPTIGSVVYSECVDASFGKIKIEYMDTAGQEKFRSLVKCFVRDASVALIVFDVTDETSFDQIKEWYNSVLEIESRISFVIVGNKTDLDNQIDLDPIKSWCDSNNFPYALVSAKEGNNLDIMMRLVSDSITVNSPKLSTKLLEAPPDEKKSSCC